MGQRKPRKDICDRQDKDSYQQQKNTGPTTDIKWNNNQNTPSKSLWYIREGN